MTNTLAFCSISALDRPLAAAAEIAAGAGLEAIEVTAHRPHLDPEAGVEAAREARRAVLAAGVEIVAYGSYLGRFGQLSRAHAEREAAIAAALEAPLLRVWAEPPENGAPEMTAAVELMQAACDAARLDGITVVVERHLGSFADTPARIDALLAAVERENLALNYQVLDFLPPTAIAAQADDAATLIHRARYFHLKNYQRNDDPTAALLPGGSLEGGVLDYRAILAAAIAGGYAGPMTIEFLAADERSVEEKLAADVRFLRQVLAEIDGR